MSARVISGKELAKEIRSGLVGRVRKLTEKLGRPPGLGVILVGEDPASKVYVRNKEKAATKVGLHSEIVRLPASASQADVLAAVERFNQDEKIDGYLVQLPLPKGLDEREVASAIDPDKDADGLLPANLGRLVAGLPGPRSCTPHGVMKLLEHADVPLEGKKAVVIGRSTIVGKPQALLLLEKNATVTVCHSRTQNLADEVRQADVVVAAVGRAKMVKGDWLKVGAAVIDVGMNRDENGKLCGDVDFESACERAAVITPVPGGVGPMTVAMLIQNTVEAAERKV